MVYTLLVSSTDHSKIHKEITYRVRFSAWFSQVSNFDCFTKFVIRRRTAWFGATGIYNLRSFCSQNQFLKSPKEPSNDKITSNRKLSSTDKKITTAAQARYQLGTPGVAKSFLRGAQIFILQYVQ